MEAVDAHALNVENQDSTALLSNNEETKSKKKTLWYYLKIIFVLFTCIVAAYFLIAYFVGLAPFEESQKSKFKAGMIGLWPTYGGGLKNQQASPNPQHILFTHSNIKDATIKCIYESNGGVGWLGFPTIDNKNNSYFTDASGYITCINLDTCEVCWRQHVGTLLGFNYSIGTHQALTIFRDSNGNEGLLFGAPSTRNLASVFDYPDDLGCYALAVHLNNGSFWWKIQIGQDYKQQDFACSCHGFYVDGIYGYGGITQSCCYNRGDNDNNNFIGRFLKIDIDKHEIVNVWYPFAYNLTYKYNLDEHNLTYSGSSLYNYPAIDDDYVVFGTSNLWSIPHKIQQCMLAVTNSNSNDEINDYLEFDKSLSIDICGNNKSFNPFFRCLSKSQSIYPSSLIILDKNTFSLKYGYRLSGLDITDQRCRAKKSCPFYYFNQSVIGMNNDLTAVSIYKNILNNKKYVIAANKAANIYSFELETGKLHFVKMYGPAAADAQFNMAIDENSMIGITTMTGGRLMMPSLDFAPYDLSNNLRICEGTGVVVAFDLNTGNKLYQIVNPYGTINESICYNDTYYENSAVMQLLETHNSVRCEKDVNDNDDDDVLVHIHIPPKSNVTYTPMYSKERAKFRGPITISNGMIFITSDTGDIFIHNLYNGSFIHRIVCPPTNINGTYNRPGIKGGVSIVNDRIAFYCGGYWYNPNEVVNGNQFVSIQLNYSYSSEGFV